MISIFYIINIYIMAKTKSTHNKKRSMRRSMRRSTRKAGFSMGFSSEPKNWDEWANQGKSDAAKALKASEGTNNYSKMKRAMHFN